MGPAEMATILKYLMSKLPEDQLAELDDMLAKGSNVTAGKVETPEPDGMSLDSATVNRRAWLAMDSRSRIAVRASRAKGRVGMDAAGLAQFASRFPDAAKIGRV